MLIKREAKVYNTGVNGSTYAAKNSYNEAHIITK
jgi:hypothetical protein